MHTTTLLASSLLLAVLAPLPASAEPAAEVEARADDARDLAITLLSDTEATASGTAVGPFVGYKYAADIGLTVDVQAGAQYLAVVGGDDMDEDVDSGVIPLLNLNVGWSF